MDLLVVAAFALLVVGVIGSVVPLVPGAALSLAGVYLYWWQSGFASPGLLALAAFTVVGLFAVVADHFGGAMAARAGGASLLTTVLASLAGIALLFVAGPVGLLVGVMGVVFAAEFYRTRDARGGARAAVFAALGVLGSAVVQLLVTLSMLVGLAFVAA
ncbi:MULTISPECIES: DUF456 domain-containing protein [Halorussus]|uniref:DUF456 domain-containing protein n=1 Tax=Halorussus TaxID=1070314 RepID=UPI00209F494F|nr:DUF456 domain-containing protein [Halorussus vallis]USZ78177.1 DUF456 domain-containing protein [Halorussus vallis]